jgi:hypothetical protein
MKYYLCLSRVELADMIPVEAINLGKILISMLPSPILKKNKTKKRVLIIYS